MEKTTFLFVGALHPRKNISRLLLAFDNFKQSTKSSNKLLLLEQKNVVGIKNLTTLMKKMTFKKDVIFLQEEKKLKSSTTCMDQRLHYALFLILRDLGYQ